MQNRIRQNAQLWELKFVQLYAKKMLDKFGGTWYNGNFGPRARARAAIIPHYVRFVNIAECTKNRVEKFSTRNMKFSVNRSDRKSICVNAAENLSVFQI